MCRFMFRIVTFANGPSTRRSFWQGPGFPWSFLDRIVSPQPYHPRNELCLPSTIGWANKSCQSLFRSISSSRFLPWTEFSYNTGFQTSTGTSPLKLVYGRDLLAVQPFVRGKLAFNYLSRARVNFTDVPLRDDQKEYLCKVADGVNPTTGNATRDTLLCS
ncbi:hypothetical protein V2J09_013292 [Rumex salicifolius]